MSADPPLDLKLPEDCPHCGIVFNNHSAMWRHKQRCDENPDPACRWCDLKFEPHKLAAHERKCSKNPANLPVNRRPRPSLKTFPRERLLPIDLLVLPLLVEPGEEPPSISEMENRPRVGPPAEAPVDVESIDLSGIPLPEAPKRTPRRVSPLKPREAPVAALEGGIAARFREALGPPRAPEVTAMKLLRSGLAATSSRPHKQRSSNAPQARPPYNPLIHGSVEAYNDAMRTHSTGQKRKDASNTY